jgi:hypothetical protein
VLVAPLALVALSFATPAASADCAVNEVGSCSGSCEVNVDATCGAGGSCTLNVVASCVGDCPVNALNLLTPGGHCKPMGHCLVNVEGDCNGNCTVNAGVTDCDTSCVVNVAFSDCDGQCTINGPLASCPDLDCLYNGPAIVCVPPPSSPGSAASQRIVEAAHAPVVLA